MFKFLSFTKKYYHIIILIVALWQLKNFFTGEDKKDKNDEGSTINDSQADNISNGLFVSMNRYGTDEDKIFSLLKGIKKPDFNKVSNFFGNKPYSMEFGMVGTPYIDSEISLLGWLNAELNEDEMAQLKILAPNVF